MQPLDSFMQLEFNKQNALPMDQWLLPSRGEDAATYDERMHLLGNIVVPAGGLLASEILSRIHRTSLAQL